MSGLATTVKELINPKWVRHSSVPPLEAGLRPNQALDQAKPVVSDFEPDDLVNRGADVVVSSGDGLYQVEEGGPPRLLARLPGRVTAVCASGGELIAAVEGVGLVTVTDEGNLDVWSGQDNASRCVTALCSLSDGRVAATVGSARYEDDEWHRALVAGDRTGSLVVIGRDSVDVVADGLGWPAGVTPRGDSELLVSASIDHGIDVITRAGDSRRGLVRNLPAFPGRIMPMGTGWLVAFPYLRNRLSELLLEEPEFVEEMVREIRPDEWLVPRLRTDNPYTSALQLGQLRVLGVLKPWAPAHSYGLVGILDERGRFSASFHSRVDGSQHGVTAAVPAWNGILVAIRGGRNIVHVEELG